MVTVPFARPIDPLEAALDGLRHPDRVRAWLKVEVANGLPQPRWRSYALWADNQAEERVERRQSEFFAA